MRTYLPILIALLAIGGLLWAFRHYQESSRGVSSKPDAAQAVGDVGMRFDGVRLVGWTTGGEKRWEMEAETITVSKDKMTSSLKGITKGVFYNNGRPVFRLKAREAIVQGSSQHEDVKIRGGLTVTGENGVKIVTPSLEWQGYRQKFLCSSPIVATFNNLTLKIERAEGDITVRAIRAVVPKSVVYRKGQRLFVLHAPGAEFLYNDRTHDVRIQGGVRVEGQNGLFLQTSVVEWRDQEEKIVCPSSVEVRMKRSRLVAEHFESDPKFEQMAVKRFSGQIALSDLPQTKDML
ncbi:MAG: hypothetical protein IT210_08140 [Armatimonadetes bacterium]|nr:hypothetical protein [Armatimonadota bacterium]